jgi:hypothetical protein
MEIKMKRYSVSIAYGFGKDGKVRYHYRDRTDNVEAYIEIYKASLKRWIDCINDENYPFKGVLDPYHGIKITDSTTKQTVYEECHLPEEFGWKAVRTEMKNELGYTYYRLTWERI